MPTWRHFTLATPLCAVLALGSGVATRPATAQDPPTKGSPEIPVPPKPPTKNETTDAKPAAQPKPSYIGTFKTSVLSGDGVNELELGFPSTTLSHLPYGQQLNIRWEPLGDWWKRICWSEAPNDGQLSVYSKAPADNNSKTILKVYVPAPPLWCPVTQTAQITIKGDVGNEGLKDLFDGVVYVSVFWFPFAATLLIIALIYPGCAAIYWYMRKRNSEKARSSGSQDVVESPSFVATLDPVQITANPYGRASLGKLQIFLFTIIVFGILLFHLLRNGVLANMSADVLLLLGISAVGAAGGKVVYIAKRRISSQNWIWLVRHGWLPDSKGDLAPNAKWSELFLDSDTKEFDPYAFQMAIFSIVVAISLIKTTLTGLGSFSIPPELLGLLGISQAVFIGGKATEKSGYSDLDTMLDEVRRHEQLYQELKVHPDPKKGDLDTELKSYRESVAQAAGMFDVVYREQLRIPPNVSQRVKDMTPDSGA